jgi:hypothetical protein
VQIDMWKNFRSCQWGDERTRQACADGEQGPPSARAKIRMNNALLASSHVNTLYGLYAPEKTSPSLFLQFAQCHVTLIIVIHKSLYNAV